MLQVRINDNIDLRRSTDSGYARRPGVVGKLPAEANAEILDLGRIRSSFLRLIGFTPEHAG